MPSPVVVFATTTTTIIFLLTTFFIHTTNSSPILGLDTFLTKEARRDKLATNDSFISLPSSIKKSLYSSFLPHTSIDSLISSLVSITIPFSLHVRLLGPSFPPDSSSLLSSYLHAAHISDHFYVISPNSDGGGSHDHRLAFKHSLNLVVSHSPTLASRISEALKSAISSTTSSLRSPILSIPHTVVDSIVMQDFEKEKPVEGVFLYLINLGQQSHKYAYNYGGGESSPGVTKCVGSIWTGKERYLWIDLNAGPVDYGPALSGDGVLPRGEFHPLAALHGRPKSQKALIADLASLVWSAYQVHLVPSLRIPVPYDSSLIVQFIHVYGSEGSTDLNGLDWDIIKKNFMDDVGELLLAEQTLKFKNYKISFNDCPLCSFAISRSTNSYTSRFLFDNYTMIVSEYLDSKRLHQILSDSADEFRRMADISEDEYERVLPVYVFDLDHNTLLFLDRFHQSVAFKDMVIAVRTKNTQTVNDYSCNGRQCFTYTRQLERPIVGSILQSLWGVAPTHMSWSPRHNNTLVDYTWSVGQTPFGPFSELLSLSFAQKDATRRNQILTSLNNSISSTLDVLDSIRSYGGDRKLLKDNRHVEFVQRWGLFKYKIDKAVTAISHLDFETAIYYLRSSDHDLYETHSLVYQASQELEASLQCFKDPPFPWGSVSIYSACVFVILYIYSKREKLMRNKRKQF